MGTAHQDGHSEDEEFQGAFGELADWEALVLNHPPGTEVARLELWLRGVGGSRGYATGGKRCQKTGAVN